MPGWAEADDENAGKLENWKDVSAPWNGDKENKTGSPWHCSMPLISVKTNRQNLNYSLTWIGSRFFSRDRRKDTTIFVSWNDLRPLNERLQIAHTEQEQAAESEKRC